MPSFLKSGSIRPTDTTPIFHILYTRGVLLMPPRVLASGPKPCGGNKIIHVHGFLWIWNYAWYLTRSLRVEHWKRNSISRRAQALQCSLYKYQEHAKLMPWRFLTFLAIESNKSVLTKASVCTIAIVCSTGTSVLTWLLQARRLQE